MSGSSSASQTITINLRVTPGDAAAFAAWRAASTYDMDAEPPEARDTFFMDCVYHQFADAGISSAVSIATKFERSPAMIAKSAVNHISVITYLEGSAQLIAGGRETTLESGDVCLLDMTQPHTLVTTPYRHVSLMVSRALFSEFHFDIDALHGLILKRDMPATKLALSHMQTLLADAATLDHADVRSAVRGAIALVVSAATPEQRRKTRESNAAASLQTLRRTIEDNLESADLGVDFLMERMGLSRATLFRLFKPLGGVRNYIQQRRLARAFQAIANIDGPEERISGIARRHGFSSDAVFSRAFRKVYGMSPRNMRTMIESSPSGAPPLQSQVEGFSTVRRVLKSINHPKT
jgi:AraC-like DNA-binding protein